MREIKFRAYDSVLGMREVAEIDFTHETVFVYTANHGPMYRLNWCNSPPLQCTGLKDKNGQEIYEGDVLLYEGKREEVSIPSIYYWEASEDSGFLEAEKSEILGNIYENPELVKEK